MEEPIKEVDEEIAEFIKTVLSTIWQDRKAGAWCLRWYQHPEVLTRVYDLYDGWNKIGPEPDDLSLNAWYRFYLDHHLPIITDKDRGPFRGCSDIAHQPVKGDNWSFTAG